MSLQDRVTTLEKVLQQHLIESGAIRADLKWLKKAVYWLMGGGVLMKILEHLWK